MSANMTDFSPYQNDFELYCAQEPHPEYTQTFLPPSTYGMQHAFSAPYDHMAALVEAPAPHEPQYHYNSMSQGVKLYEYQTPAGSPHSTSHSTSHSFHELPPILSASSESGASVSSSATGSPFLHPHVDAPWSLGFTTGCEYPGMMATEKTFVGKSAVPSYNAIFSSESNTFKTPITPASAWSSVRPNGRRGSLLSIELYPSDLPTSILSPPTLSSQSLPHSTPDSTPYPIAAGSSSPPRTRISSPRTTVPNATKADPTLIQPFAFAPHSPYADMQTMASSYFPIVEQPPSPTLSQVSSHSQQLGSARFKRGSVSPYLHTWQYQPYPKPNNNQRRGSVASLHSHHSTTSRKSSSSYELDTETREKGVCPLPECGRSFKDLKAHMLTHQSQRPERCPISTCEYSVKGFARKYDKNRHTLTHYKGTMVCGFCPGSGSAVEKSFNRADVFKRHLTSVHGVDQNPTNSRRKSSSSRKAPVSTMIPNLAGTCSTCSVTFANAQEFYEHLDDCVLRVVQQADPTEAINQRLLTSVAEDKDVAETLDRNGLSKSIEYTVPSYHEQEEEDEEEDVDEDDDHNDDTYGARRSRSTKGKGNTSPSNSKNSKTTRGPRAGLTFSKGGVAVTGTSRKRRKNYPVSWGCPTDKMKMKKRVMCVYDGPRRLWKDDMMLDQAFEVRMKLPGGRSYVTDLDVQTLKRAEAMLDATPEEKGPWQPDNIMGVEQYMF